MSKIKVTSGLQLRPADYGNDLLHEQLAQNPALLGGQLAATMEKTRKKLAKEGIPPARLLADGDDFRIFHQCVIGRHWVTSVNLVGACKGCWGELMGVQA